MSLPQSPDPPRPSRPSPSAAAAARAAATGRARSGSRERRKQTGSGSWKRTATVAHSVGDSSHCAVTSPCRELWHLYNHGAPVPKSQWSETPLFRDPKTGKPLSYTHMLNLLRYMISKLGDLPDPNLYALH